MYTQVGFEGDFKELFKTIDKKIYYSQQEKKDFNKHYLIRELERDVNLFFNYLDKDLYNQETMTALKKKVKENLPQYTDIVLEKAKEQAKIDTVIPKMLAGFFFGGLLTTAGSYALLSLTIPSLTPLCFLMGFWGGVIISDEVDKKITNKYNSLEKQRIEKLKDFLNV